MRALVVLDGDPLGSDAWLAGLAKHADVVIAADGGAMRLSTSGRRPDLVVGDLDSLPADAKRDLERAGAAFEVHPDEKEETDAELALDAAVKRGADEIVVVGAFGGGRLDHMVGNLLLLAHEDFAAIDVAIVTERATFRSLVGPGTLELEGTPGDWVSLEPLSEIARGVITDGLRYPLRRETLVRGATRGVSNELTERRGSVELAQGLLLVAVTTRRSVASR
ncbi:MAG TPA: thiamine diphosphokinase [Chloroflexi bacterium]|jgi:thiamine pyrophosphokinase|nr:thiamine diphosphokinase [Chloroflexota bacterium]HAL27710.1 thiamine diphosphokinase [Chloroflexota bacterium]